MNGPADSFFIAPGNWLGMVGGGQLGRMFCHAAQSLGYRVAVLDPAPQCPAGVVADLHIQAAYDDPAALDRLGALCRAVTTEFENVPAASLAHLAEQCRVSPAASAVAIAQDRIREKAFIRSAGVPVVPYAPVSGERDLAQAPDALFPGLLKQARLGYDGKGQARVDTRAEALHAFARFGQTDCVLEALAPLDFEISVVMARGLDGATVAYAPSVNLHRDGILAVSRVGPALQERQALYSRAQDAARLIACELDYHGVLCVEFFVLGDGSLLANEIAPRPHNSGHHTIDACASSQFEQQVRVMAGLPLGDTAALGASVMVNILGDAWFDGAGSRREPDWKAVLAVPQAALHLYGKHEARPGRKMGHVTVLGATPQEAEQRASLAAKALGIQF